MGYELVDLEDETELERLAAMVPPRYALQPQQLRISDALDAGLDEYVIEVARRAAKTTTIFMKLIGRCASRPGYQVTYSAQSGVAGSRRLREWAARLDRITPPDDQDLPPWLRGRDRTTKAQQRALALFGDELLAETRGSTVARRGFRIMRGEVGKGIYFDNGSQFLVLKPDAESYRGEAADASWLDELQEVDPDESDDLAAGIVPLMDTKPGASLIGSGTTGEERAGLFWKMIKRLRDGDPTMGGLDYAVDPDVDWAELEDEERAMELLAETHPGVGTLTTPEKMRANYRKLPRPEWAREYLCLWPTSSTETVIDPMKWQAALVDTRPRKPARVAFGFDVKPGGGVAAIAAAWRDSRGNAHIEVVDHRIGTDWLPARLGELTRTYRGSTAAYDDIAEGKATATECAMLRPRPRLRVQTYRETAAGCVQIMRDLARGKLRHQGQTGLEASVAVAGKREVRNDQGVWLWTLTDPTGDITPLVAATRALRNWDQHMARANADRSIAAEPATTSTDIVSRFIA